MMSPIMADAPIASISELLPRARNGDQQALASLFASCRNYVHVIAQAHVESWLRAKVDASDLVQQTLLDAYRGLARFQGASEAEWLGWLRTILQHNAADFVRKYHGAAKRQVGREVPLGSPPGDSSFGSGWQPDAGAETPSQMLVRKEREMKMADALMLLPPDYREVVQLRNLQRMPFDEVAQRMGRSRPAAQMLWMRAIQKLRELVGDGG
jgi:RNA polymerase sigma-70 factor (ECF subfamily)